MYCHLFFFKQKTAYEMRISDWSSDVCSSDLVLHQRPASRASRGVHDRRDGLSVGTAVVSVPGAVDGIAVRLHEDRTDLFHRAIPAVPELAGVASGLGGSSVRRHLDPAVPRSEEPTSALQSLIRSSYAVS